MGMKRLWIALVLAVNCMAQGFTLNPMPIPTVQFVRLYEVPLGWEGCTLFIKTTHAEQCFMSLADILTERKSFMLTVPYESPALTEESASWVLFLLRIEYGEVK